LFFQYKVDMATSKSGTDAGITMEHLATLAGVSTITVSRALRDSPLVTEKTREKVRRIAQEQGYRLNISARNLRMGRSHSVAVVVEMTPVKGRPMSDPYPLELLGGITQELTTAGYSVVLTSRQLLDTAPVRGADGMILLGQGPAWRRGQGSAAGRLAAGGVGAHPIRSRPTSWSAATTAPVAPARRRGCWRWGGASWCFSATSTTPKCSSAAPVSST
jgi:transcriptional regulator with XRE-family HTH domain